MIFVVAQRKEEAANPLLKCHVNKWSLCHMPDFLGCYFGLACKVSFFSLTLIPMEVIEQILLKTLSKGIKKMTESRTAWIYKAEIMLDQSKSLL